MKQTKLLTVAAVAVIIFLMAACPDGGNSEEGGNDPGPANPEPMSTKTAMQYFKDEGITVGINMGNTFDAVRSWAEPGKPAPPYSEETAWGNPKANQALFNGYRDMGFKIVRIPVTWNGHIGDGPEYKVEKAWLERVAEAAGYANTAGLKAIINMHHDDSTDTSENSRGWLLVDEALKSAANRDRIAGKYEEAWKQIAEHFKYYGDWLMFQGFNEIHSDGNWAWNAGTAEKYAIINDWNQRFTNAVRSTGDNNASRYLLYYGYMTTHLIASDDYALFKLPDDSAGTGRQVIGFHWYLPTDFVHNATTHEWPNNGGEWFDWSIKAGSKDYIDLHFGNFKTKFVDNGIPVIIGECGPFKYNDFYGYGGTASINPNYNAANVPAAQANRLVYIDYMFGKAKENGITPIYWETGGDFALDSLAGGYCGLFNRNTGQPNSAESRTVIEHMIAATK